MTRATFGRIVATLGLGLILGAAAAPTTARQDPGPAPSLPYSQDIYENHYGTQVAPREPAVPPVIRVLRVDDNAIEYLQLGAGLLAGAVLAGVGMALAARRTHPGFRAA